MSTFVRDPEVEAAASTRVLVLLCYSMLAGQQPPCVACVCVQLALSRRVASESEAAAGCSRFERPRCNALRDGVGSALPDGALVPVPQGSGAQASDEWPPKASSALLLLHKAASWWLVAAPRALTRVRPLVLD